MIKRILMAACVLCVAGMNPVMARVTGLPDFTSLVEQAGPAVVNIQVTQFGERARNNPEPGEQQFQQVAMAVKVGTHFFGNGKGQMQMGHLQ